MLALKCKNLHLLKSMAYQYCRCRLASRQRNRYNKSRSPQDMFRCSCSDHIPQYSLFRNSQSNMLEGTEMNIDCTKHK
jgi:hypothetical protein